MKTNMQNLKDHPECRYCETVFLLFVYWLAVKNMCPSAENHGYEVLLRQWKIQVLGTA